MRRAFIWRSVCLPVTAGILAASLVASRSAGAVVHCEHNVCFTSDGNCDLSDFPSACREIAGTPGCENYTCPAN